MRFLIISTTLVLSMFITSCNITNQFGNVSNISNVKYIALQNDKYLWVAGEDKLMRWDVQTKKVEEFSNMSGRLLVDNENALWVFDINRVSRFDGGEWEHFSSDNEFVRKGLVFSVIEANGYIWFGTGGLSRYNQRNKSWNILFQTPQGPAPTPIPNDVIVETFVEGVYSIASANREAIWVGTTRGLTYWEDNLQQTWTNKDLGIDGRIPCLLRASDETVWVCTENGVGRWDGIGWANIVEDLYHPFLLVPGEGEEVWVVSTESGIAKWNGVSWDKWTDKDGLASQRVTSLIVSTTDANIWVGTNEGVSRWNGKRWHTYTTVNGLTSNYVTALVEDPRGGLWAGTRWGGINYYDSVTDQWQSFP